MRIAYVHDDAVPSKNANAVHVMKMCAALAKEGVEVTLFCPFDKSEVQGENVYTQYGVKSTFKIVHVKPHFLLKWPSTIRKLSVAYKSADLIKKDEFDFVLGRSMWALYCLKDSKPFVFETHMVPMRKRRRIEKSIFSSLNLLKVIMITEGLRKDYLQVFPSLKQKKIAVLQDAADVAQEPTEQNRPSADKLLVIKKRPVIGYLGHLYPGKCMEILSQIAASRPQYDFHIVGGKEEWVQMWKEDERCKNLKNIFFYGYVNNNTIPYYYSEFDISILPFSSQIIVGKMKNADIARWTSPLKLFEAMSYGKAILATNLETVKEVLTDGENCLLESPDNIEGWCEKLDLLVENGQLRGKIGKNAKKLFERKYTWAIRAKAIINIMNGYQNEKN